MEFTLAAAAEKAAPDRMPVETVSLETSLGRILREHIDADGDYPRFDKAIRDGFAVRFEDLSQVPAVLEILGESRAGQAANVIVTPGTCCEIMTGAPMPEGANAVVMVEHTEPLPPSRVRIMRTAGKGRGCFDAQPSFTAASESWLQADGSSWRILERWPASEKPKSRCRKSRVLRSWRQVTNLWRFERIRLPRRFATATATLFTPKLLLPEVSLCCSGLAGTMLMIFE